MIGGFGDGGFGGGGFSAGGFSSPGVVGGDKQKKLRSQSITPLTVAQVMNMTNDDNGFHLGEMEIGQITLIGIITNVDKSETSVTYSVDDTTAAPIAIKHWYAMETGDEDGGEEQAIYNEGTYVRVYAQVRSFQNKLSLSALKIHPLTDMNELSTHMLEVVKTQMVFQKKYKEPATSTMSSDRSYRPMASSGSDAMNMGMDKIQSQVCELIAACPDAEGISFSEIKTKIRGLNMTQIKNALEFLSNEGHIYTTIDEDHFKATR